jgi:hypothetical protein
MKSVVAFPRRDQRWHGVEIRFIRIGVMTEHMVCKGSYLFGEYKYPRQFAFVRALAGLWFVILTGILLGYQREETWAWLLVPCAALSFLGAWYIPRAVAAVTGSSDPS